MNNFMEIIVEPVNPQSLEFKMSEAGGVQCEQSDPYSGQIGGTRSMWDYSGDKARYAGNAGGFWTPDKVGGGGGGGGGGAIAPAPVYVPPPRDTSRDPSWWGTGGKAPQRRPQLGSGGQINPTNPMVQSLGIDKGTNRTYVGEATPMANALRQAAKISANAPTGGKV
jgi:hypothetical protein